MEVSVLAMGFMIGLRHAVEPDHLAAVSNLMATDNKSKNLSFYGFIWGLGHTLGLILLGGTVVVLNLKVNDHIALILEALVGAMLLILGFQLIIRIWKEMNHLHSHADKFRKHSDGHGSSKATFTTNKTALIGLMHGLAGSASLIILAATTTNGPLQGMSFIILFGIGSMLGMGLLTTFVSFPVAWVKKSARNAFHALQIALGVASLWIGYNLILPAFN